ncbi:MAG: tetratricopeptide repeat protein [Thermoleophilia bacterium]|nr:tetratricopeptide repeat protein [Thermoleophilia bacterium]
MALVLVVAISLLARLWAVDPGEGALDLKGPLVSAVTGTTDRLTSAEQTTDPTVAPAPGRAQPSQEEWEALLPRVQAVVDADPGDVNALRKLALAHYNLGHLDEAAAIYEDLLAIEEDSVLRNRLGNTLRDMGDLAGAEAAYRRAIADDPTIAPHYLNLVELLWRQGRGQEALAVLDEGLGAVPEESRAALEDGREVLETTPD